MKRLISRIEQNKFTLIPSLHRNSVELACIAEEEGADAIEVHINDHSVDSCQSGGFELEETSLKEIANIARVPVGIAIGDERPLTPQEWESILNLNFDFVDMYAHHMPSFVLKDDRISKMLAIGSGYLLEQVKTVSESDYVDAIKAAIVPQQGNSLPLNALDLATLSIITRLSSKPVMIPTQRLVRPSDLSLIKNNGCRGVIITAVVTGTTTDTYRMAIREFRQAIGDLEG
ncbi:MAG: hypothetical protein HXX80_03300 [Nitrososphaerales archaeon]|nr:hypothetical protein [Nitrososphaerales archaeon]